MKTYLKPIMYDFKRSMLRLSTLTLLIMFLLGGIGASYLTYSLLSRATQTLGYVLAIVVGNNTCNVYGIVVDFKGEVVNDFELVLKKVEIRDRGFMVSKELYRAKLPGNMSVSEPSLCNIISQEYLGIEVSHRDLRAWSSYVSSKTFADGTKLYLAYGGVLNVGLIEGYESIIEEQSTPPPTPGGGSRPPVSSPNLSFIIILGSIGLDKWVDIYLSYIGLSGIGNVKIEYSTYELMVNGTYAVIEPDKMNFTILTNASSPVFRRFRLNLEPPVTIFFVVDRDKYGFTHHTAIYVEKVGVGIESAAVSLITGQSGLGLFILFFPVALLYLVYVLVAKPKSIGALEFVIARPITRGDLFLTRLIASYLVVFVSTTVFMLTMNASLNYLIGVSLESVSFTTLYLGTLASFITITSLYYLMACWLRSGRYLGVSIALFLVFSLFWDLIAFIVSNLLGEGFMKTRLLLSYFNPLGSINFASYFVSKHYYTKYGMGLIEPGVDAVANPVAVYLQPIVMTVVFVTLGYLTFRRVNLTQ